MMSDQLFKTFQWSFVLQYRSRRSRFTDPIVIFLETVLRLNPELNKRLLTLLEDKEINPELLKIEVMSLRVPLLLPFTTRTRWRSQRKQGFRGLPLRWRFSTTPRSRNLFKKYWTVLGFRLNKCAFFLAERPLLDNCTISCICIVAIGCAGYKPMGEGK